MSESPYQYLLTFLGERHEDHIPFFIGEMEDCIMAIRATKGFVEISPEDIVKVMNSIPRGGWGKIDSMHFPWQAEYTIINIYNILPNAFIVRK